MFDLIIKNSLCLLPDPKNEQRVIEEEVDIGIKNGYIQEIGSISSNLAPKTCTFSNLLVLPGLIDSQVHFREPGLEHKEDINHGTRSAIKGGITAIFEMPNTKPATMTEADLDQKIQIAQKQSWCDFAFYAGAGPANASKLYEIEKTQACCGVKLFLGNSTGDLGVDSEEVLNTIFKSRKRTLAIHSEDETRLQERKHLAQQQPLRPHNHLLWRDDQTAILSTKRVLKLAEKHKTRVHVLHVTTKEEIALLKNNKHLASVEVTPQHLTLAAPECYDRLGAFVQMNPPIRTKDHQEALWEGIISGVVDVLGSDHAPHTREEKNKTYPQSPSGMPGTQTLLPLMLNHVNNKRLDMKTLVKLLAHTPAQRFNIKNQGKIKKGYKAHFTVIDLKAKKTIETQWLESKCGWSPFENMSVTGWPIATMLYGQTVMKENEIVNQPLGKGIEFTDLSASS